MSSAAKFFSAFHRATTWTCRTYCPQQRPLNLQSRLGYATRSTPWRRPSITKPRSKRRRRILLLASTGFAGAGVLAVTDHAKHAATAVERSGRVLSTLMLCINESVTNLHFTRHVQAQKLMENGNTATALPSISSTRIKKTTMLCSRSVTSDALNEHWRRWKRMDQYSSSWDSTSAV